MRRTLLLALLATALVFGLGVWSLGSRAQVIDGTPCSDACYQQKAACVSVCAEHSNPIECESECREQLEDCLDRCE